MITHFGYAPVMSSCSSGFTYCDGVYEQNPTLVRHIIQTLGDTYDAYLDQANDYFDVRPGGAGYVQGILGSNTVYPTLAMHDVAFISTFDLLIRSTGALYGNSAYHRVETVMGSIPNYTNSSAAGSFLVAPVPLPGAAWLFVTALGALIGKGRLASRK